MGFDLCLCLWFMVLSLPAQVCLLISLFLSAPDFNTSLMAWYFCLSIICNKTLNRNCILSVFVPEPDTAGSMGLCAELDQSGSAHYQDRCVKKKKKAHFALFFNLSGCLDMDNIISGDLTLLKSKYVKVTVWKNLLTVHTFVLRVQVRPSVSLAHLLL